MKPYYDSGGITIYHGRAEDVIQSLGAFALVLTDIPYGKVNRESGGLRGLDKGFADEETVPVDWMARSLPPLAPSVYVFCGTEQVSALRAGFVAAGMTTRLGIWEKTNPSPMNGEYMWLSSLEVCVFGRRSGATFTERCASPVWRGPSRNSEAPNHTTPKPLWLFSRLILASSKPGDVVLDPFMGSGTSLRAAKDAGRLAVGIDQSERCCEDTARRLAQEVLPFEGGPRP